MTMNIIVMENLIQVLYEQAQIEIRDNNYKQASTTLDELVETMGSSLEEDSRYGQIKRLYAEVNRHLGKFHASLNYAREALEVFRLRQQYLEVYKARELLGDIYYQYGKVKEGLIEWEAAHQILSLFKDEPEHIRDKAQICRKIGEVLILLAEYDKARFYFLRGLNHSRTLSDQILVGRFYLEIGITFHQENSFKVARRVYHCALKMAVKNKDRFLIGRLLHCYGDIYTKTDQLEKARKNYEKSLEFAEKVKDFFTVVSNLRELGRLYLKIDPDQTLSYYEKSFDKLIENISTETRCECEPLMAKSFYLMALYYFKIKDYNKATKSLTEAGELFTKYHMEKEKKRAHFLYNHIIKRPSNSQTPFSHSQSQVLAMKLGIG